MPIQSDTVASASELEALRLVTYPVMEHFYTIQGEGAYTGYPAYFIRLGGCDVQCFWCDVKDSWDESKHPKITVDELAKEVLASEAKIVVITGGEPTIHNLEALTKVLHSISVRTHIETSGSSLLTGEFDWVTLSPKKFKAPLESIYPFVDELKVVVLRKNDFEYGESHAVKCVETARFLLQPEWDNQDDSLPMIIDYVKRYPKWSISLQTHKFMGVR